MTLTKNLVLICLYCLNCTIFDQLILRKSLKIVIRCQILRLKYTKFDFGWGIAPDPLGQLTDPIAGFKGTTSKGKGGREGTGGGGKRGKEIPSF